MNSLSSDEISKIFTETFGPGIPISEIKGRRFFIVDTPISVSIVVMCDIRVLVQKCGDKWAFPNSFFSPKKETVQQTASRILLEATNENLSPQKWIPVDIRSHPERKDVKNGQFSVDIGYATLLELPDVPIVDTNNLTWALVDFDNGKFPLPLIEDHDQLWEATFGVFNILFKS